MPLLAVKATRPLCPMIP